MGRETTPYAALQEAVAIAGSQSALARICGISSTAVWKWVAISRRVSPEFVLQIEAETGVSRHALRPDIYPVERQRRAARKAVGA